MKLCAIFVTWNDWDLLAVSTSNIRPVVDGIIIVASRHSNFGAIDYEFDRQVNERYFADAAIFEPRPSLRPHENEAAKRNHGLELARRQEYTHFIMMDSDEFYDREEFRLCKKWVEESDLNGIVHPLRVLFGKPTLWCNDHTLVPGIQRITPNVRLGDFKAYPFAYDPLGNAHIDPTRRPSFTDGIHMSIVPMWHASWVRKDFSIKIENSSARNNIKRSTIYDDLRNTKPGYYCKFYRDELKEVPNQFNIPEWELKL